MFDLTSRRTQHAVGQGAFHSASIFLRDNEYPSFHFVYDCGAQLAGRMTAALIDSVISYTECTPRVDALILSHFDFDHINGARMLASKVKVQRVYVPYLSPKTLILELTRQAANIGLLEINELFGIANGGALWGTPVTRVQGRPRGDEPEGIRYDNSKTPNDGPAVPEWPALDVTIDGNRVIPSVISHDSSLEIADGDLVLWYLKFWNYGADERLAEMVIEELNKNSVNFPVAALSVPEGAATVADWLSNKVNRDAAIDSYFKAILRRFNELGWKRPSKGLLPNLISLAAFSGPTLDMYHWVRTWRSNCTVHGIEVIHPIDGFFRDFGWVGTGDAPLGEDAVWFEFYGHFQNELEKVNVMLMPHHGAAPKSGPHYYRDELNKHPGMMNIFSAGEKNNYKHPKAEVLRDVLLAGGRVTVVTENKATQWEEEIVFSSRP